MRRGGLCLELGEREAGGAWEVEKSWKQRTNGDAGKSKVSYLLLPGGRVQVLNQRWKFGS